LREISFSLEAHDERSVPLVPFFLGLVCLSPSPLRLEKASVNSPPLSIWHGQERRFFRPAESRTFFFLGPLARATGPPSFSSPPPPPLNCMPRARCCRRDYLFSLSHQCSRKSVLPPPLPLPSSSESPQVEIIFSPLGRNKEALCPPFPPSSAPIAPFLNRVTPFSPPNS